MLLCRSLTFLLFALPPHYRRSDSLKTDEHFPFFSFDSLQNEKDKIVKPMNR